jgi:transcriptional regulator with XRE-family HTH domain
MVRTDSLVMRRAASGSPNEDLQIPLRLKKLRLARGMRLADLAAASECSESLISKIENGKATPSLNTLHRLAKALGTKIALLLSDSDGLGFTGVVARQGERQVLSRMGLGGVMVDGAEIELLIPFGARSTLQATLLRVYPGYGSDGFRQHEGDEVGYVIAGEVMLTVGGDTYHLRAGDSFFFPSTRPHAVTNPNKDIAEIIWVNTPPSL